MKPKNLIYLSVLAIVACNQPGKEEVEKIKSLAREDSLKAYQAGQRDSVMTAYLADLDQIQNNLDQIKQREHIITMSPPDMPPGNPNDKRSVVEEIQELDNWIVQNDKKMNELQSLVKRLNGKNAIMENLVEHLTNEVSEKDEEISKLQTHLGKADDSIRFVTARFNDSINVIRNQRVQLMGLNTVYYIAANMKDLQDKGIIDKMGGFVGMGRVAQLTTSPKKEVFLKGSIAGLKGVNLHGRFRRFITTHPDNSYEIMQEAKTDSLVITAPSTFWSESRYLVIAIK